MTRSLLFGRRIHICGSISEKLSVASTDEVKLARELVKCLVCELLKRGAAFVVPIDAEKPRLCDKLPICFDWLVLKTLHANLASRPPDAPDPLVVAVQHHKTEQQIPAEFESLWDGLRASDLVQIENVSHWNMNSKRMEAQAKWGDILIALGGSDGVLFLADLYHDAGKPVVPLNAAISRPETGARHLFSLGLSSMKASRLFQVVNHSAHVWINRINFTARKPVTERVGTIIALLEDLQKPAAFFIRLMNPDHDDYQDVQSFFDKVVRAIIEEECGYRITEVDGQRYDYARIDQEIFEKLHRSSVVLADITGMRPNCLLELGYALGRGLPTMLMAKEGEGFPFDIYTLGGLRWKSDGTDDDRRQAFRKHWEAIKNRPPIVSEESLAL